MDLYRTLRLSIYLVAAAGGFAIAQTEGNATCLLAVLAAAGIAWVTVDSGRIRPVRPSLSAAFGVVLLLHYLATTMASPQPDMAPNVPRLMHFLCALQIMLFFTRFRGSLVFTFCGANLFIVIVSGRLNNDVTLLLRLVLYMAATSWLLFVHAMWLERQRFEVRQAASGAADAVHTSSRGALKERAFWQGLRLTTYVTLSCLLAGFLLFFIWPRATFASLGNLIPPRPDTDGKDLPDERGGHRSSPGPSMTGPSQTLDLNDLAPIHKDSSQALRLVLDQPAGVVAGSKGTFYLRDRVMAVYRQGHWVTPAAVERRARLGERFVEFDPQAPNFLLPNRTPELVRQEIRPVRGFAPRTSFNLTPLRRIEMDRVEMDEEGAVLLPDRRVLDSLHPLVCFSNRPVRVSDLPDTARVQSPHGKYTNWKSIFQNKQVEEIEALRNQILTGARNDRERIDRLLAHFSHAGNYRYTLDLAQRQRTGNDPICEFLLSSDPRQRQGHCGYFATAFVILCRSADLPARLATGFSHTLNAAETTSRELAFRMDEAHAWAEIYFEGYGWVAFDPTGGVPSADPERPPPTPSDPKGTTVDPGKTKPIDPGWASRSWSYFLGYDRDTQERFYERISKQFEGAVESAGGMFSLGSDWGGLGVLFTWLLVGGAGAALLFVFWNRQERRRAGALHIPRSARVAVSFYQELLHVLSRHGFLRRPGQTPREFAASVVRRGGDPFLPALVVTQVFERVRYGGEVPTSAELEDLRLAMETLSQHSVPTDAPAPS